MSDESLPAVPWKSDATESEAQTAFDAVQAKYRAAYESIKRGEKFSVGTRDLPQSAVNGLTEAFEAACLMVWGRGPSFLLGDGALVVQPNPRPEPPAYCSSCGQALNPIDTVLRWQSPGRAALCGHTGWEHMCNTEVPQAGYFPAALVSEHAPDSPRRLAEDAERAVEWREAATRRHRHREAVARLARDGHRGHLFVDDVSGTPPICGQCGLSKAAFDGNPDCWAWRCPGEPPAPANISAAALSIGDPPATTQESKPDGH